MTPSLSMGFCGKPKSYSSKVAEDSAGVAAALLRFLQFGSEGLFLTPAGVPGPPFANHFVPPSHTHPARLPMSCRFYGGHSTLFLAGGSHRPSPTTLTPFQDSSR